MSEVPSAFSLRTTVCICAVVACLFALVLGGGAPAEAQQVDCERVTYNGRIVLNCTTSGDRTGGVPTATPASAPTATPMPAPTVTPGPTPTPTPTPTSEADDPAEADEPTPTATPNPIAETEALVDRGDRGGRGDDDGLDEQGADTSDESDNTSDPRDVTRDDEADRPIEAEPLGANDAGTEASDFVFDTTPDPEPSTLPFVAGTIALLTIGSLLFLAARRATGDTAALT